MFDEAGARMWPGLYLIGDLVVDNKVDRSSLQSIPRYEQRRAFASTTCLASRDRSGRIDRFVLIR